jgi:hypothetical protein
MNDAVYVSEFDAEPLGLLGTVAWEAIAFLEQCLDAHWAAYLLCLDLLDQVVDPPIVIAIALDSVAAVRRAAFPETTRSWCGVPAWPDFRPP